MSYIYNANPKNITPFQNSQALSGKAFQIIKDFNITPYPNYLSFRTDITRYYNEVKTRNIDNPNLLIKPTFRKDFYWNRYYDLRWDITKGLKFDFNAGNIARIDEPQGGVDKNRYRDEYDIWKDSVLVNLKNFGRNTHYYHTFNVSYTVPINKLPLLDWVTLTARYNATYDWYTGPQFADTVNINLGNRIQNSNTAQLNGQLNLVNLYNKIGYLREVNQKSRSGNLGKESEKRYKTVTYERENMRLEAGKPKAINHKLMTEDVTVRVFDENNVEIEGVLKVDNDRRVIFTPKEDYKNTSVIVEGQVERKPNPLTSDH